MSTLLAKALKQIHPTNFPSALNCFMEHTGHARVCSERVSLTVDEVTGLGGFGNPADAGFFGSFCCVVGAAAVAVGAWGAAGATGPAVLPEPSPMAFFSSSSLAIDLAWSPSKCLCSAQAASGVGRATP